MWCMVVVRKARKDSQLCQLFDHVAVFAIGQEMALASRTGTRHLWGRREKKVEVGLHFFRKIIVDLKKKKVKCKREEKKKSRW
jgi:hypothetical protein